MTIPKNSKKAAQVIGGAYDVRFYSLSNNFEGQPIEEGLYARDLLKNVLNTRRDAKLKTCGALFYVHCHSNLWYEFKSTEERPA